MKTPSKRNGGPGSLRTGMSMESTRDKMEEEIAGSTGPLSNGESPHEGRALIIQSLIQKYYWGKLEDICTIKKIKDG